MLVIEAVTNHPSVVSLFIDGNRLDNEGASAVAGMLKTNGLKLKELHIGNNNISASGLNEVFDSLRLPRSKLRYLDISDN